MLLGTVTRIWKDELIGSIGGGVHRQWFCVGTAARCIAHCLRTRYCLPAGPAHATPLRTVNERISPNRSASTPPPASQLVLLYSRHYSGQYSIMQLFETCCILEGNCKRLGPSRATQLPTVKQRASANRHLPPPASPTLQLTCLPTLSLLFQATLPG